VDDGPDGAERARRRRVLYGRRTGHRLRPHAQGLLDTLLPHLRVPLDGADPLDPDSAPAPLDPRGLFAPPPRALWLEVGFGGGEHLAAQAEANPDVGIIGCEPFVNGVAKLLIEVEARNLANVRIHTDDARPLIEALPEASLERAFVLFPDPWPKARHHKRRFIQTATLDALARALVDGGELRVATDIMDYARWTLAHAALHSAYEWLARRPADWRVPPADWKPTRYEAKARAAGRPPVYLRFRRLPRVAAAAAEGQPA
jgi:tRNA (guanine-N7-)-methyltransferase